MASEVFLFLYDLLFVIIFLSGSLLSQEADSDRYFTMEKVDENNYIINIWDVPPTAEGTHLYNGNIYKNKGDWDSAIREFNEAIRLNPNYSIAYNERGNTYYCKGEWELAIADFNEVIRLNPNNANDYNTRGVSYYYIGEWELANADFTEAIRLDPNNTVYYNNREKLNAHLKTIVL